VRGQGAVQTPVSSWQPLPINARVWNPGDAIRLAGSVEKGHSASDSLESRAAQLGRVEPVRVDSQAKYAHVVAGLADVAYSRRGGGPGKYIWDHAGGILIAREAGAWVADTDGSDIDCSQGRRLSVNRAVICAARGVGPLIAKELAARDLAEGFVPARGVR
jgi:3'-phosphoadenosine 5'-phosphosulfate (PAPS) 3'-phosphatase